MGGGGEREEKGREFMVMCVERTPVHISSSKQSNVLDSLAVCLQTLEGVV